MSARESSDNDTGGGLQRNQDVQPVQSNNLLFQANGQLQLDDPNKVFDLRKSIGKLRQIQKIHQDTK